MTHTTRGKGSSSGIAGMGGEERTVEIEKEERAAAPLAKPVLRSPSSLRSRSVSAKVERPLASTGDRNSGRGEEEKKEIEDAKQKSSLVNLIWFPSSFFV